MPKKLTEEEKLRRIQEKEAEKQRKAQEKEAEKQRKAQEKEAEKQRKAQEKIENIVLVGFLDTNKNLNTFNILGYVSAIKTFNNIINNSHLNVETESLGTKFQRLLNINDIETAAYTNKGKTCSPAALTFCQKSGLCDSQIQFTSLSKALLNYKITTSEYALILLTKQWLIKGNDFSVHLIPLLYEFLRKGDIPYSNKSFTKSLLDFIKTKFNIEVDTKSYRLEFLRELLITSTLVSVINTNTNAEIESEETEEDDSNDSDNNNLFVIIKQGTETIWNDLVLNLSNRKCPFTIDKFGSVEYYEYIANINKGLLEFITKDNYPIYSPKYPHLFSLNANMNYINQIIFYGAPGTGKSFAVDGVCKEHKNRRTTFHPDSDYSTFVGCYKPTMGEARPIYGFDSVGKTVTVQDPSGTELKKRELTYEFVPQAFTNAYVDAWTNPTEPVFLVIEEINRGNCAQIFGDLFQLLDRQDDGYSSYPIDADTDLQNYLCNAFANADIDDIDIKSGAKLLLPPNLYIWATMNTSDQSLFPIDSAFKRRWDWKYIKITEGKDDAKQPLKWKIVIDKDNGKEQDWWNFIKQINKIIAKMTDSSDKQLGYFFCKADDNKEISAEKFVNKVLFYLWNDVFKDYGMEEGDLFKYTPEGKTDKVDITFPDFYNDEGNVEISVVDAFIQNVMNWQGDEKKTTNS